MACLYAGNTYVMLFRLLYTFRSMSCSSCTLRLGMQLMKWHVCISQLFHFVHTLLTDEQKQRLKKYKMKGKLVSLEE